MKPHMDPALFGGQKGQGSKDKMTTGCKKVLTKKKSKGQDFQYNGLAKPQSKGSKFTPKKSTNIRQPSKYTKKTAAQTSTTIDKHQEMSIMRNLISTIHVHPNILGHEDFDSLRQFVFNLSGVQFSCSTTDITIPLEPSESLIAPPIHPVLPKTELPAIFSFGLIHNMIVHPETRVVTIHKFSLTDNMKTTMRNVLNRVYKQPRMLYSPSYIFLYEFCVQFGGTPHNIEKFVEKNLLGA